MRQKGFALILVVLIVMILVISAYLFLKTNKNSQSSLTYQSMTSSTPSPTDTKMISKENLNYTNTAYGFKIELPISWQDAQIQMKNPGRGFGPSLEVPTVSFVLKEPLKGEPGYYIQHFLNIVIFTKEQNIELRKIMTDKNYNLGLVSLGENDKYVFYWEKIIDVGIPSYTSSADFIQKWKDVENISSTFRPLVIKAPN